MEQKIYLQITPKTQTRVERIFTKYEPTCIGGWYNFMGPSIDSLPACYFSTHGIIKNNNNRVDLRTRSRNHHAENTRQCSCKDRTTNMSLKTSYLRSIHTFLVQSRLSVDRTSPLRTVAFFEVPRSISRGRRGREM